MILALCMLMVTREMVLWERTESALRVNSFIDANSNAWNDWSHSTLYNDIRNKQLIGITTHYNNGNKACSSLDMSALSGANEAGQTSATLFTPIFTAPAQLCETVEYYGPGASGEPLIGLISQTANVNITNLNTSGNTYLNNLQSINETSTAFRGLDMETMLTCFPEVQDVVSNSLDPMNDTENSSTTVQGPLPSNFSTGSLQVAPQC